MLSSEFVSDSDKANDEPDSRSPSPSESEINFPPFDPDSNADNVLFSPVQSDSDLSDAKCLSPPQSFQASASAATLVPPTTVKGKGKSQPKATENENENENESKDKRKREKPTGKVPGETSNKTKLKASIAKAKGERKILKPKSIKDALNPLERMVREGKL